MYTYSKKHFYRALFFSGMLAFSGCNQTHTDKSVARQITKAQKAIDKAKAESTEAIEARKALFMQNRQSQINDAKERIKKVDQRLSALNDISKESPNQSAVNNVNSAMSDFDREKEQLNQEINNINAQPIPNWEPTIQEINQKLDTVKSNLNLLNQNLVQN